MRKFVAMNKRLIFLSVISAIFTTATNAATTQCASQIYADSLAQTANTVNESDSEDVIKKWIYSIFTNHDTVAKVLKCPEISSVNDNETIKFAPIQYTFPLGRQVTVNYETQPKVLKQRLSVANKRDLPNESPNPDIINSNDGTIWTNVDPVWYAIMVVESGTLDNFIGPDKNNTISLQYIIDNIDTLYPHGNTCTSRSALFSGDYCAINRAGHETVDIKGDTNDYYVAGDINLEWIGYAEIAADVAITVLTMGGGAVLTGVTKSARASRALKGMASSLKGLRKLDTVQDYIKTAAKADKLANEIKALDNVTDAAKIAEKTKELDNINDTLKTLNNIDDVKKYKETLDTYSDLNKYRKTLQGIKAIKQRGNVVTRGVKAAKSAKAAMGGNKLITQGTKLGRASKLSARVNDFLFDSTMKNLGRLGKMQTAGGALYGTIQALGGMMYDFTDTSTGEFTNDIEFKPLLLLSADDIQQGDQADKINYGMWLMWAGDSSSAEDDDAAYLQAMDFAAKFHEDLDSVQDGTNTPCNVDIYVAKPILKNPGSDNPEIYYLIMNDTPWTTNNK